MQLSTVGGAGPGRVCNLHGPMWHSWVLPKARPRVRRGGHDREDHDLRVVHTDVSTHNQLGPVVQRTTTRALGARSRGSNPRRPICRAWGEVSPLTCYVSPRMGSRFDSEARRAGMTEWQCARLESGTVSLRNTRRRFESGSRRRQWVRGPTARHLPPEREMAVRVGPHPLPR
jgi:hypothetical protein